MKKNLNPSSKLNWTPQHLFNQGVLPKFNHKEVWVKHPTLLVEASNNGRLRHLEDDDRTNRVDSYLSYQLKKNIIWSCWNAQLVPDNYTVIHLNGNINDERPENLGIVNYQDKEYVAAKRAVFQKAVEEMLIKEKFYIAKGFDMYVLWDILGVPKTYINAWELKSDWAKENKALKLEKPSKNRKKVYTVKPAKVRQGRPNNPYKGVCWNTRMEKWKCTFYHRGKKLHCGYFDDPAQGNEAYQEIWKQYRGD